MQKVITYGVFDYLHLGHIRLFNKIRDMLGHDVHLTVAVHADEFIHVTKPDAKMLYQQDERIEMLRQIRCVDDVVIYDFIDTDLPRRDFDILVVGPDQTNEHFVAAKQWCADNGRRVVVLPRTENISSTEIKSAIIRDCAESDAPVDFYAINHLGAGGKTLTVRAPTADDFDAYIRMLKQIARETKFTYHYPDEPLPSWDAQVKLWQSPHRYTRAAFDGDKMVGYFCVYVTNPNHPYLKHNGGWHTYILQDYTGHGLGTWFMQAGLAHAANMGIKRMASNIHADNTMNLKSLQQSGFVIESVAKNRYFVDGKYIDCLEMVKWIDK